MAANEFQDLLMWPKVEEAYNELRTGKHNQIDLEFKDHHVKLVEVDDYIVIYIKDGRVDASAEDSN